MSYPHRIEGMKSIYEIELEEKNHALELALCASQDEYDTLVRRLKEFVKELEK